MPYQLVHAVPGAANTPYVIPETLTVPTLAIEVRNLHQRKQSWKSAGTVQAIASTNVGEVRGKHQWINFGRTELRLEIPAFPYQLVFTPNHWLYAWNLELYVKTRSGSDGTPTVPLSEAETTATGWVIW